MWGKKKRRQDSEEKRTQETPPMPDANTETTQSRPCGIGWKGIPASSTCGVGAAFNAALEDDDR